MGSNVNHITLLSHKSKSPCIPGHSYGSVGSYLYVDHGCRAVFRIYYRL
ncbi:hypothetical protein KUTeg_011041 [Tegillarca granosa]|uniref:Uncharacterized protein n=1 Tax=Tegillarca granosa TaxID=220873 RepID=A0ABQ9F527_TEGGR|nr:hypothetical protein KUTeg_011041 [Tegillarca granosa]